MNKAILLLAVGCLAVSFEAAARMYQWLDSASGNVRLSGDPPPWYRGDRPGPRTLVFENGRIIDDTAIILPRDEREALRQSAFEEVDFRREQDAVKKLERAALREERRQKEARTAELERLRSQVQESAQPATAGQKQEAAADVVQDLDAEMVDRLKSIVSEWDKQQPSGLGKP
jgi:hypothetical protein